MCCNKLSLNFFSRANDSSHSTVITKFDLLCN
jgi:hypothetical protein